MENRNEALTSRIPKPTSSILVYLIAIYAACLLIANILANHMIVIINWTTSAGILTFPLTYILASVISEVYGYRWARNAAWLSLALNALLALLVQLSIFMPGPIWYDNTYFIGAIGGTWRVVLASLTAFTLGKFVNDKMFAKMKLKHTDLKGFTFRAIFSSLGGHIVDTTIFTLIAFAFVLPWEALPEMIIVGVLLKLGYELVASPLTLQVAKWVSRREKMYESSYHGQQ